MNPTVSLLLILIIIAYLEQLIILLKTFPAVLASYYIRHQLDGVKCCGLNVGSIKFNEIKIQLIMLYQKMSIMD
jgi:hypothetical protein